MNTRQASTSVRLRAVRRSSAVVPFVTAICNYCAVASGQRFSTTRFGTAIRLILLQFRFNTSTTRSDDCSKVNTRQASTSVRLRAVRRSSAVVPFVTAICNYCAVASGQRFSTTRFGTAIRLILLQFRFNTSTTRSDDCSKVNTRQASTSVRLRAVRRSSAVVPFMTTICNYCAVASGQRFS